MNTKVPPCLARANISLKTEVQFMAGSFVLLNRFSVSRYSRPCRLRVVLDWDRAPLDLDAHLIKVGAYHIHIVR